MAQLLLVQVPMEVKIEEPVLARPGLQFLKARCILAVKQLAPDEMIGKPSLKHRLVADCPKITTLDRSIALAK